MPRELNDIMELLPEGELQWKAQSMPQSLAPTVRVGLNRGAVLCPFQGRFRWCRGVPGVGTPGWHVSPRWGGGVYRWTKRKRKFGSTAASVGMRYHWGHDYAEEIWLYEYGVCNPYQLSFLQSPSHLPVWSPAEHRSGEVSC